MPQTNELIGKHEALAGALDIADPRLVAITRIRLLSDADCPFWDVSYVHGLALMPWGEKVRVRVRVPWGPTELKCGPGFTRRLVALLEASGNPMGRKLCRVNDVLSLCW